MKGIGIQPRRLLGKQGLNSDPSLPQNGQPRSQPCSLRSGVQEAQTYLEPGVQTLTRLSQTLGAPLLEILETRI